MILRPGAVLGLPQGVPDPVFGVVALRYVLMSLALVWAVSDATAKRQVIAAAAAVRINELYF